jgi:hypothetical protein
MLVNITYNDKKLEAEIMGLVGKPFGLIENIRLQGVGSPRLDIINCSQEIAELLSYDNNRNFCNIELRPKGIIIRFRSLLETFGLIIPYYKLVIFKPGNHISFHMDNHVISIEAQPNNKSIHVFMEKLMQLKIEAAPSAVDDL